MHTLRQLEKELEGFGLDSQDLEASKSKLALIGIPGFNWHWKVPGTAYMLLVRHETHRIRCVGQDAWHFNVQLRDTASNSDAFNLHIGAGRSKKSGRITVFVFDTNFEICKEIPNVQDLKQTIQDLLNRFLQSAGISLPVAVVAFVATAMAYLIILVGIPSLA